MANKTDQHEIDALRDEVKRLQGLYDAAESEVAALRSGKEEARSIAAGALELAAERDALKRELASLAAHAGDLMTIVRSYEANSAPPADVLQRVNAKRYGNRLQNGVPAKALA